jgi:hypothetical protein
MAEEALVKWIEIDLSDLYEIGHIAVGKNT